VIPVLYYLFAPNRAVFDGGQPGGSAAR
jgi:hypothetical protein